MKGWLIGVGLGLLALLILGAFLPPEGLVYPIIVWQMFSVFTGASRVGAWSRRRRIR